MSIPDKEPRVLIEALIQIKSRDVLQATIRYENFLTRAERLMDSQLNLPHGTEKSLVCRVARMQIQRFPHAD